jgi:hypothetical protein
MLVAACAAEVIQLFGQCEGNARQKLKHKSGSKPHILSSSWPANALDSICNNSNTLRAMVPILQEFKYFASDGADCSPPQQKVVELLLPTPVLMMRFKFKTEKDL